MHFFLFKLDMGLYQLRIIDKGQTVHRSEILEKYGKKRTDKNTNRQTEKNIDNHTKKIKCSRHLRLKL